LYHSVKHFLHDERELDMHCVASVALVVCTFGITMAPFITSTVSSESNIPSLLMSKREKMTSTALGDMSTPATA
jgi:hypothetical protein